MTSREEIINSLNACMDVHQSGLWSSGCMLCAYERNSNPKCYMNLTKDVIELLKHDEQTIASLQSTICKLNAALAEQPEQKHGHWVFDPDGVDWNIPAWKCSECHCRNDNIPPNLERTNPLRWSGSKFCSNCGAKMDEKVEQDG